MVCCTTDTDRWFCLNRERPLQQASNTLLPDHLWKRVMHQQDPDGMKQYSLQDLSKRGYLLPLNSLTESTPWNPIGEKALTEMCQQPSWILQHFPSQYYGTQERISHLWYFGPSILNGQKNSSLACGPLNFRYNFFSHETKVVGLLLPCTRTPLQYFKSFHIHTKYGFLLISSKCSKKVGRFHTPFFNW